MTRNDVKGLKVSPVITWKAAEQKCNRWKMQLQKTLAFICHSPENDAEKSLKMSKIPVIILKKKRFLFQMKKFHRRKRRRGGMK